MVSLRDFIIGIVIGGLGMFFYLNFIKKPKK